MNPIIIAFVAIIIAVVSIVLAFRFGKYFFKLMTGIFFLGLIGLIIFGAMVVNDLTTFNENIFSKSSLLVLQKDGNVLTSVTLKPEYKKTGADIYEEKFTTSSTGNVQGAGNPELSQSAENLFTISSESALTLQRGYYGAENYNGLLGNNYKVFIFNASMFEDQADEVLELGDLELTAAEALQVIYSDDSNSALASLLVQKKGMTPEDAQDMVLSEMNGQTRGNLFILMISSVMGSDVRSVSPLLPYLQDGSIQVYPNTLLFQVFSGMPIDMSKSILGQSGDGEEE